MCQIPVALIKSVDYVAKKMFHDIMLEKLFDTLWEFMDVIMLSEETIFHFSGMLNMYN
jgi:hypothetical protein